MRLDELEWQHVQATPTTRGWRIANLYENGRRKWAVIHDDKEGYDITVWYDYDPSSSHKQPRWHRLDAVAAQAVIYYLLGNSGGNDG